MEVFWQEFLSGGGAAVAVVQRLVRGGQPTVGRLGCPLRGQAKRSRARIRQVAEKLLVTGDQGSEALLVKELSPGGSTVMASVRIHDGWSRSIWVATRSSCSTTR